MIKKISEQLSGKNRSSINTQSKIDDPSILLKMKIEEDLLSDSSEKEPLSKHQNLAFLASDFEVSPRNGGRRMGVPVFVKLKSDKRKKSLNQSKSVFYKPPQEVDYLKVHQIAQEAIEKTLKDKLEVFKHL
jgi:hypothetical protein